MQSQTFKDFGESLKGEVMIVYHSQYFVKQLDGPWKEGFDKAIHIEDFGIDVVKAMVYFMYHFDYKTPEDSSSLILNTKVYQIADKYGIKSLKELAAVKFGRAAETYRGSDDFLTAITLVYTTTPSTDMGLQNSILVTTFEIYEVISRRSEFYEALKTNPDFANDLTRFLFEKTRGIERIHCFTCKRIFQFGYPRLGLEEAFAEVKI
ncbi:hypothetical protein HG530_015073 [Fusarium avenaceum]|nr:hypothetical protein HG530_015073 [Fusarium avenaceum]